MEIWNDIRDYEGLYQVSTHGRVRSLDRIDSRGHRRKGRILKYANRRGYRGVILCKDGITKTFSVHRLVALHFIDNEHGYPEVNHIDENKENNKMKNLEWCNGHYNNNYGTRNYRSMISQSKKVICIDTGEMFENARIAAEAKSCWTSNINSCCNGKLNTTGGYRWAYA